MQCSQPRGLHMLRHVPTGTPAHVAPSAHSEYDVHDRPTEVVPGATHRPSPNGDVAKHVVPAAHPRCEA